MVLIGILMVIVGFALKLDSIAVIIISALATGFAAHMDITEILSVLDYYNSNMTKQLTNRIINSDFTLKLTTPPAREIIGFVTHGLYDYNSNQGKGHGYILINQYEKIINLKRKFGLNFIPALLRKKTSLIYYLISLYE